MSDEALTAKTMGSLRSLVLVIVVVALVIGVLGYLALMANDRWSARSMVQTGISAVEALIEGDADGLAAVSNETVRSGLTPMVRAQMRNSGILVEFGEPTWDGNVATIKAEGGMGSSTLVVEPAPDGKEVVVYRTMGAVGFTNGAVSLARTKSGWIVTGLAVAQSAVPTTTPSGTATSTETTPAQ